jgi:5-methylcytosine-specific restriction protein A
MPRAAHICPVRGCIEVIPAGTRYCAKHLRVYPRPIDARPSSAQRGYGPEWRKIRDAYLREHPFCVICGKIGNEVDHIIALKDGGSSNDDNLRTFCKHHHSRRTAHDQPGGFIQKKMQRGRVV